MSRYNGGTSYASGPAPVTAWGFSAMFWIQYVTGFTLYQLNIGNNSDLASCWATRASNTYLDCNQTSDSGGTASTGLSPLPTVQRAGTGISGAGNWQCFMNFADVSRRWCISGRGGRIVCKNSSSATLSGTTAPFTGLQLGRKDTSANYRYGQWCYGSAAFWNRELRRAECERLVKGEIPLNIRAGLVAYYPMNEAGDTDAIKEIIGGNNLTVTGTFPVITREPPIIRRPRRYWNSMVQTAA